MIDPDKIVAIDVHVHAEVSCHNPEDPVMAEKLQLKLHGIDRENCGLPGSRAYEDRLFQVLQSKLSHKK